MAKVQAKKAASAKKQSAAKKAAARPKKAAAKKKASPKKAPPKSKAATKKPAAKKVVAKKAAAKKKAAPKKAAAKKIAAKKTAAKKTAKKVPAKKVPKVPAKKVPAKKAVAKKAPAKKVAPKKAAAAPKKVEKKVEAPAPPKSTAKKVATAAKNVARVAAVVAAAPVVAKAAKAIAKAIGPSDEKKRARRPRTRVTSTGVATANWFATGIDKPRPSSFIPAPPRAEAPSLVAAPPASSDRLIRPEDLTELAVRTVPVRVDVEQSAGRVYVIASPNEVILKPGEGIEWDFRYLGGADVTVEELLIEFDKPSPFTTTNFKSRKPGAARPHRQLSGAVSKNAAGRRANYTIRALNMFKTELANTRLTVSVEAAA